MLYTHQIRTDPDNINVTKLNTMTFHINYDTYTTFKLIVTKPDQTEETVVGEFYDISMEQVNYIILNWKMVEAFGLEFLESEDKGSLREY